MKSLRRQLTVAMLLSFALLLSVGGAAVYWGIRESLYKEFDEALRVKALIVVTNTALKNGKPVVYFSDRFLREFDQSVSKDFFDLFDEEGRSVARSDSLSGRTLPRTEGGSVEQPRYWNLTRSAHEQPLRAIGIAFSITPRAPKDSQVAPPPVRVSLTVASDRVRLDASLTRLRLLLLVCGAGLVGLTLLVIPRVLRRGMRPLEEMSRKASHIDANSLGERFQVEALPAELHSIGGRLNDLLARLEASFERERRFSSDLAHELRTPLAELRAQAELALKWPEERDPAMDRSTLEIALHMEALVSRLLVLARAEQGRVSVESVPVELLASVETLVTPLAAQLEARHLELALAIPAGAQVQTDTVIFRSIVANLLGNAVAYAPEGSRIEVTFEGEPGAESFSVSNKAPELSPEDLPRLFERFWRKDASRSGNEHSGLGLALSRSFAELLNMELRAELTPSGRLVMSLRRKQATTQAARQPAP